MNKTTTIGTAVLAVLAIGMVAPVFASAETATITPVRIRAIGTWIGIVFGKRTLTDTTSMSQQCNSHT